ncbi:RDD family protein [Kaarinaea lacus]
MRVDSGASYAGFWRRCGAAIIDSFIFSAVLSLTVGPEVVNAEFGTMANLLGNLLVMAVTLFCWIRFLGTPGKLLLECQVVDADSGEAVKPMQALLRYLGYFVSLFLTLGLGFLWIAWDKRKQGFHDKIANTLVLYSARIEADDESQKSIQDLINELR